MMDATAVNIAGCRIAAEEQIPLDQEEFERAVPDLVKTAFDDPSGRSNPRMPLMSELAELFWKAYMGRGHAAAAAEQRTA